MIKIPEMQRKIAIFLLSGPKTAEEIKEQLQANYADITKELNIMIKKGFVKKEAGYPTKYALDSYIVEKVKKRKQIAEQDSYQIKAHCFLEVEGIEKNLVEHNLKKAIKLIEKEKGIKILDYDIADVIEQDNLYSGYVELYLHFKDFPTIIYFICYYVPSSIDIMEPERLNISLFELQEGLNRLSIVMQKYSTELLKRLAKEDIARIQKKIFE